MAKITYIDFKGADRTVEVKTGQSVMEGAVRNNIPGIVAECGGSMSCGTCHVHVDARWIEKTGRPSAAETDTLDFASEVDASSRLSCQIKVTDALDGLIVRTPQHQGS